MTAVTLTRTNHARRMVRFYVLDVQPDLFGQLCFVRKWGRIGRPGHMGSVPYPTEDEAHTAAWLGQAEERDGHCHGQSRRDAYDHAEKNPQREVALEKVKPLRRWKRMCLERPSLFLPLFSRSSRPEHSRMTTARCRRISKCRSRQGLRGGSVRLSPGAA